MLGESELAGSGALAVLEAAWEEPLNAAERQLAVGGPAARAPVGKDERAMEVAAARLRTLTDRRLGKQTPEWVTTLAAG
ncbi:MAG TPA: hypothetical protein VF885_07615 [Arthrobacter sp.]